MHIQWGKVLTSKTVWLGVLMVIGAIIEYFAGLPAGTSTLQALSGVFTILVRFLTKDAIVKS